MVTRRIAIILILLLLFLFLFGCTSKAVSDFEIQVEEVSKSTEISDTDIISLQNAYNELTAKEKTRISNYEQYLKLLSDYEEGKAARDFDKEVQIVSEQETVSDSDISYLQSAYENLSPSQKAEVKNYDLYVSVLDDYNKSNEIASYNKSIEDAIDSYDIYEMMSTYETIQLLDSETKKELNNTQQLEDVMITTAYDTIMSYKNANADDMYNIISFCQHLFTNEQLEDCFAHYATYNGVEKAEDYLKEKLKNPGSYHRYSGTVNGFGKLSGDGGYAGHYDIKYGAENAYGGEVTYTETVYVKFFLDLENLYVDYAYVGDGGYNHFDNIIADPTT